VDEMHCELAGGEFERFKENFAAPHGETYTVTIKAGKNTGFTVQTGGEGQCMKFMVVGVIPDSQAHAAGVAPGCTVVKVNGTNVRSVNELMPLVGSGDVSVTLERPGFGHVVAKTGQFAGKPTCSTWKAMGLSHDKLDAAFGHSHFSEWSEDELEYFYESMARSVSFLCKHPDGGKKLAAVWCDAPYWEKACMEDPLFTKTQDKLVAAKDLPAIWAPMKCCANGAPENFSGKDAGPQNYKGIKGMMGRYRISDFTTTAQDEDALWTDFDDIRWKQVHHEHSRLKLAKEIASMNVEFCPPSDYTTKAKYWDYEIVESAYSDMQAHLFVVKDEASARHPPLSGEGVWKVKAGSNAKKVMVIPADKYGGRVAPLVCFVDESKYHGLATAGTAPGLLHFRAQANDASMKGADGGSGSDDDDDDE
jgi:hypothetical protein